MKYSRTPPSEDGFYFFRTNRSDHTMIGEVGHDPTQNDGPPEELFTVLFLGADSRRLVCDCEGEWAGPIPPPVD